jgi:hypothetical protein
MLQKALGTLAIGLACTFALSAAETSGRFVEYDTSRKELTVDVNGAKSKFTLTDDVKIVTARGETAKKGLQCFANPKVAKPGAPLTVITAPKDGKDVVTEIKLGGRPK